MPVVSIGGYQGFGSGASSFDHGRNYQGTVNVTKVTSSHTLRGGVDARLARRIRTAGGNPSGSLAYTNDFTKQASDNSQLTPSNLGLSMAAFMLGIPTTTTATIQQGFAYRNHYLAGFGQDSWRLTQNLTLNVGLRFEWEDGISEDSDANITDFDPTAKLAISDLAEQAYARSPIAGMPAADFHVRGGSVYANAPGQDGMSWRPEALWMPRVSAAYKLGDKTVVKGGYGLFYDTLNAGDYGGTTLGYNSTTQNTNSNDFGQTFSVSLADPFPVRSDGTRFIQPYGSTLGVDTSAGNGGNYNVQNQNHIHARQQKWRIGIQRELVKNLSVEVAYDGSYSDRGEISIRQDYLPQQFWIPGSLNARDAAKQAALTANVTNPYAIGNFTSLQTSNPLLYQKMSTQAFFTSPTVQANRLLRPFSQLNNNVGTTNQGLFYDNLPLGEVKVKQLQINMNRRFNQGFTANVGLAFSNVRSNRTVEEYDRVPTLWQDSNDGRPYRLTGGAVYELPFGDNKPFLSEGGILAALAGGWQLAGTFEVQPGSLLAFNNLFFTGDINNIKKDKPEIALHADGTIDPTKYWFNVAGFETDAAKTPTSFQTRAFPFQIDGLRGPGLHYVNLNVLRNFRVGGRRSIQTRLDVQNLFNYAAFSNPNTDPTNTNFGKVTTSTGSAGAMRFVSFGLRFAF